MAKSIELSPGAGDQANESAIGKMSSVNREDGGNTRH